jgi:phosphate acetyltransferase
MADTSVASIEVAGAVPAGPPSKYDRLIAEAKRVAAAKAIVVHPCDETSLRGAIEAAKIGLIIPTLVGPVAKIERAAREHQIDISAFEVVDAPHSDGAAAKAVELIRAGQGDY